MRSDVDESSSARASQCQIHSQISRMLSPKTLASTAMLTLLPLCVLWRCQEAHINTCYKHFYYFVKEFKMIEPKELEPLVRPSSTASQKRGRVAPRTGVFHSPIT